MRVRHPWDSARRSAASLVLITSVLAVACAPAAPVSPAATAAPAKPAAPAAAPAASPGASPAASPAASPGAAVAPATAAGAVAQVKPKGSMTMVLESEPATILLKDAVTDNSSFLNGNVYDQLTARDWSSGEPKIVPELAESFEQSKTDPKTWRFKLRQGLKFINGEPVTSDAVVAVVNSIVDPAAPGLGIDEFGLSGAGVKVTKIDEYTVDITTAEADAIFPARLVRLGIPAPKWLASMPNDASITQAVGTGPYKMVEYVKGDHFLLKANEDYWGPIKPKIAEIKIIFRNEAAVRASMIQAGEVQLATLLTPEAARALPAHVVEQTGEVPTIRINTEHPVLKDLRVRQALNMAFDRKSMIDSLYGDMAEPVYGQTIRKSSTGWSPNIKDYPYDPAKAKQLVQEAGAVGQPIEMIARNGQFPRIDEVTELFANQVNQTGLKVTVRSLEQGQWTIVHRQVKPGEPRSDLFLSSFSDPVQDLSRSFAAKYRCGGVQAHWCDQEWTAKYNNALGLGGEARSKTFQELAQVVHDQNTHIPLFGLNFMHGTSPKFHWDPAKRYDIVRDFTQWTLDD